MVNAETWTPMLVEAREIRIGQSRLKVPSLDHLFALKFHVLRQEVSGRGYKDLLDVLALADCNGVDLRSDRIRHLCHKYGSEKIYERLLAVKG
jgi:predicted nucleotidyltransferase